MDVVTPDVRMVGVSDEDTEEKTDGDDPPVSSKGKMIKKTDIKTKM